MRSFSCIQSEVLYCNLGSEVPEMTWATSEILVKGGQLVSISGILSRSGYPRNYSFNSFAESTANIVRFYSSWNFSVVALPL